MLSPPDAAGGGESHLRLSRRSLQLGFTLIAFIHITLATHSPDNAKHFRNLVQRVDAVQEAYSLTGDADYLLKVVLRDLKSLSDIVNNVLMPHRSVAHVRSSIVLDRLKETSKLPLKELGR
jgi:DNA-binding Lrp family transcriptional regulator